MDAEHWALIIGALASGICTIIAAVFAGLIALKQLPHLDRKVNDNRIEAEAKHNEVVDRLNDKDEFVQLIREEIARHHAEENK